VVLCVAIVAFVGWHFIGSRLYSELVVPWLFKKRVVKGLGSETIQTLIDYPRDSSAVGSPYRTGKLLLVKFDQEGEIHFVRWGFLDSELAFTPEDIGTVVFIIVHHTPITCYDGGSKAYETTTTGTIVDWRKQLTVGRKAFTKRPPKKSKGRGDKYALVAYGEVQDWIRGLECK